MSRVNRYTLLGGKAKAPTGSAPANHRLSVRLVCDFLAEFASRNGLECRRNTARLVSRAYTMARLKGERPNKLNIRWHPTRWVPSVLAIWLP
jgi:hypothetical protein